MARLQHSSPLAVAVFSGLALLVANPQAFASRHKKGEPTLEFIYYIERTPEQQARQDAYIRALGDYSLLRAWQKTKDTQETRSLGELEYRVDLNGDGIKERLVSHGGPAAYSWYAIFTRRNGRWRNIGDANMQDHSKLKVLRTRHHGWRDFSVDIERSRGAIERYIYTWSVKERGYDLKSEDQIRPPDNSGDEH